MPLLLYPERTYPAALKTVLRTEKAISATLQTSWTLQGACVVGAVHAPALAVPSLGHGGNNMTDPRKALVKGSM